MAVQLHFNQADHPVAQCVGGARTMYCCYMSMSSFTTHASGFGDFKNYKSSQQLARFLQLVAYVVQNPHVAYRRDPDIPKPDDENDNLNYDASNFAWRKPIPEFAASLYFQDPSQAHALCIKSQQFIDCDKAVDGTTVVGYRLWFIEHDVTFNFAQGILNTAALMKRDKEIAEKRVFVQTNVPTESEKYRHLLDIACWTEGICDSYFREHRFSAQREAVRALTLTEPLNPAHPQNVFSVDRAMEFARLDGAQAVQCTPDNYVYRGADATEECRFPCPHQVWRIHSEQFHPKVVAQMQFPNVSASLAIPGSIHDGAGFSEGALHVLSTKYGFGRGEIDRLKKSDLLLIAEMAKKDKATLLKMPTDIVPQQQEFIRNYHQLKANKLLEFKKIWDVNSTLSDTSLEMIRWYDALETACAEAVPPRAFVVSRPHIVYDKSLSIFAT